MTTVKPTDGGDAFPNGTVYHHGMSLRDWFAGQALSGLLKREPTAEYVARRAYAYADAMLKAREAGE